MKNKFLALLLALSVLLTLFTPVYAESGEYPLINGSEVSFLYQGDGGETDGVYLAGSFTSWADDAIKMAKDDDNRYTHTLTLPDGTYEYKFIIRRAGEDQWIQDPLNPILIGDNSTFRVGDPPIESPIVQADGTVVFYVRSDAEIVNVVGALGSYNNWDPANGVAMEKDADGVFTATITLPPGEYEYKYIEGFDWDAKNYIDPGNPNVRNNNSLLIVPENPDSTPTVTPTPPADSSTLLVRYRRVDGDYDGWDLWCWPSKPNAGGTAFPFGEPDSDGFVTADVSFPGEVEEFGFIVRYGGDAWTAKDGESDRFTSVSAIWLLEGDATVYTSKPADSDALPITYAVADSDNQVKISLPSAPDDYSTFAVYLDGVKLAGESTQGASDREVIVSLTNAIADVSKLCVARDENGKFTDRVVVMRSILDKYYYSGDDLGLTYAQSESGFKVWAPTAANVSIALYDHHGDYSAIGTVAHHETDELFPMTKDGVGVWSGGVSGDLAGKYYMYKIEFADGVVNYAVDPYARAVSANGQRTAILNLTSANPENWAPDSKPSFTNPQDAVIYELHVRDFSMNPDSGMENKGKYLAFTEKGAVNEVGTPTGLDHIKDLGVTHVHLNPVYDFATINEIGDLSYGAENSFNWGYDPQNYNVPEGSYSTDPQNPSARITEFKQMVQAMHDEGIRVVMDVVYNHTYATSGGPFDPIVPGYYYRTTDTGVYSNGTGCGNEVATERPMVRKYIRDSVLYWAKEYNIDGFRFDLMALIDTPTMRQIVSEVHSVVDPSILIYGEPWQAGGSVLAANLQTLKGTQKDEDFSVFNDQIRTAIKGGSDNATKGFATGELAMEEAIVKGVQGSVNDFTNNARETINYVTAHDNLNLWDKIATSLGSSSLSAEPYDGLIDPSVPLFDNPAVKSVLLANGIVLTAQGIPFFQAGDEILRSKFGDYNSYKSPDTINTIRWENASAYQEVSEYYAGLIELRKQHPAFRMDTKSDINAKSEILTASDQLVAFSLKDNANGDAWNNIVVAYNASTDAKTVTLPNDGAWRVVVNDQKAGVEALETISGNSVSVSPVSMMVLYDSENYTQTIAKLEVVPKEMGLEAGDSRAIKTACYDQNGNVIAGAEITYSSSDGTVAAVSSNGRVTGVSEGSAVITVTVGGLTAEVIVHVGPLNPAEIIINGSDNVAEGYSVMLSAYILDQYGQAMNDLIAVWSSDDPDIASISATGAVKGIVPGKTVRTASYGDLKAELTFIVTEYVQRYLIVEYYRPDGNYIADTTGLPWDLWTWETGAAEGQFLFEEDTVEAALPDGTKIQAKVAYIPIGVGATQPGVIVRKGAWADSDDREPPGDRKINLNPTEPYTKVLIISGLPTEDKIYPEAITTADSETGKITFLYRDFELFKDATQTLLQSVSVNIDGKSYEMTYDPINEMFTAEVEGLTQGQYEYSFTYETNEGIYTVSDPNNTELASGKSYIYVPVSSVEPSPTPTVSPSPSPSATPTVSPSPVPSTTPTVSPSPVPTTTPAVSPSLTATPMATPSPDPYYPRRNSYRTSSALPPTEPAVPSGPLSLSDYRAVARTLAEELYKLKLFIGVNASGTPVFELDRPLNRIEALALLERLLGAEEKAAAFIGANPFTDVPAWADRIAAYAYNTGITVGINNEHTLFDPNRSVTYKEFTAFLLRALGYREANGDFAFDQALSYAVTLKLYSERERGVISSSAAFLRGDAVVTMTDALLTNEKGKTSRLIDKLAADGFITAQAADAFVIVADRIYKR
ncbi:MAG: type I pullulanase [Clostridiales bacterium]|jgi:pullulanase|nr:type I pullulanase [Clostridiales bacterium]